MRTRLLASLLFLLVPAWAWAQNSFGGGFGFQGQWPPGYTWSITAATCTGDGNGGTLTVNGSNQIICAADDGVLNGLGANLNSTTDDILSDNGTILLGGTGNTNNETIDCDYETTANTVACSSPTGVTLYDYGTMGLGGRRMQLAQVVGTGTVVPILTLTGAAHTALTASTERFDTNFNSARIVEWATGALSLQRFNLFQAPTIGFVGASTVTDTCTLCVSGAPVKGTNATLSATHAIRIGAGAVSTATASYGLTVNAQTGATTNYAAAFLGGGVGIGTASPGVSLHIVSSSNADLALESGGTAQSRLILRSGNAVGSQIRSRDIADSSFKALILNGAHHEFQVSGSIKAVIDTSGNIGFGNTAPAGRFVVSPPGTQTIAATNTITADACGTTKSINSVGDVTTNTTNTFTAPAAANTGCIMTVCNIDTADTITLDQNALFETNGGTDIALAPDECVMVNNNGAKWRQSAPKSANL